MSFRYRVAPLILGVGCLAAAEAGGSDAAAQANNPLANTSAFNVHDYFIGEFTGVDEPGNQLMARYATPFSLGSSRWLSRTTIPVNTYPDGRGDHTTGLGDINAFAAWLIDVGDPAISFGVGPQLTVPSASEDELGTGKWSAGFANVFFSARSKRYQYGYLLTWQASFAGDEDREDVNVGAFQPFFFYQLGEGWYARSSAIMVYDIERDDYTVPLGAGAGKVIPTDSVVYNAFIEPQYSLVDEGSAWPQWQVFGGFNMQF